MRNLCFVLLLLFVSTTGFSQSVCGFDVVHQSKLRQDRNYRKTVQENERSVQIYLAQNRSRLSQRTTGLNTALYTIPVVVHIMHTGTPVGSIDNPTDAQIQGAIDYLNQVYNGSWPGIQGIGDLQIQFQLASVNSNCNPSTGIERIDASSISDYAVNGVSTQPGVTPGTDEASIKDASRWNPFQFYNIWVVNKIDGKDGTSGTFTGGYAYFPGAAQEDDGVVILATQMTSGNKTLPHELGHAFGLYHVFEGSSGKAFCPSNSDCSNDGDRVCDTDPVSYNQVGGVYDFICRTGINSCTGTPYNSSTESNYMNYTNCYTLFTAGQKARMLAYAESIGRKGLATSLALETSYPLDGFTPPAAVSCAPASSSYGMSQPYAGILNIEINDRDLSSSATNVDHGYVDGTTSCLNLVRLQRDKANTLKVQVVGANDEQIRGWIDFNNDGVFNNSTEQIIFEPSVTSGSPVPAVSFSVPQNAPLNTVLRMRVMDDLTPVYGVPSIANACADLSYGQAEDYPVYITSGLLPVTLVNFTGIIKDKLAQLSWKTADEINLQDFEVQKSSDGAAFSTIGTVRAKGAAGVQHEYSFADRNPLEKGYYRLRMNDIDGSFKLSKAVLLIQKSAGQTFTVVNNPFGNYIEMKCGRAGEAMQLQLINTLGVVVAEKNAVSTGSVLQWWLPQHLSKGHYILEAITGGELFTYKLVKQ